jgi:hypothetical protein
MKLADAADLVCGQTEARGDGESIALCEDCHIKGWCEDYPVIQKLY